MIRYLSFFIIALVSSISLTFGCASQPDIIHEFRIETASGKSHIHYSLMAWRNLHTEILREIRAKSKIDIQDKNPDALGLEFLLSDAKIYLNGKEVHLKFVSGSTTAYTGSISEYSYIPDTLLQMEFETDTSFAFMSSSEIRLEFTKNLFSSITPFIHTYIYSDIQKGGKELSYIVGKDNKTYFQYDFDGRRYAIRNDLKESPTVNIFTLFIEPVFESMFSSLQEPSVYEQTKKSTASWFSVGAYLDGFLSGDGGFFFKLFGICVAVFAGMIHGLLPGHAKSLIGTYMIQSGGSRYRDIVFLVGSVTISHTIFIFILATIILALQKGIGGTTAYVTTLSSIGYILFGIYFFFSGARMLRKIRSLREDSLFTHVHSEEDCSCYDPKKTRLKGTILSGLLAGCNPCIDALALFVLAVSIGSAGYAFLIIIFFSLGLGLTLGIVSLLVKQSQRWLRRRSPHFSEKVSAMITIGAGVLIVMTGIYGVFA